MKDVDLDLREIRVRDGKGRKDRVTMLASTLVDPLKGQLTRVRALHDRDLADGCGWVALPDALARKYPNTGREWAGNGCSRRRGTMSIATPGSGDGIICMRACRSGLSGRRWCEPD